ncbi:MAG: TRAP transporter small permease [Betaproteobacteria bacterium]|nr:TRAP transporter small permease [Betaproteobacteria bacterium]
MSRTTGAELPLVHRLARYAAIAGGFLLTLAMLTTVASVVSNTVFGKPILGDTEIVEALVGVAVAAFMPWCQTRGANVIVDFFTMRFSVRVNSALDAIAYLVFALVAAVITWRIIEGTVTQYEREHVSMFLKIPTWWGYGLASTSCVLWVGVCIQTALDKAKAAAAHHG